MSRTEQRRYQKLATLYYHTADNKIIPYKARRLIPRQPPQAHLSHITLNPQLPNRLDTIAATYLGNAELFWQICDDNQIIDPFTAVQDHHYTLKLPTLTSFAS